MGIGYRVYRGQGLGLGLGFGVKKLRVQHLKSGALDLRLSGFWLYGFMGVEFMV